MRVVPEGQEYRIVKNAILDIDGGSEAFNLDISVPAGLPVVEGSAHASVAASGSAMTQTLENVERLVQQPHGCGEQNILVMAPCVFALDYLDTLGKAMPEFKEKESLASEGACSLGWVFTTACVSANRVTCL